MMRLSVLLLGLLVIALCYAAPTSKSLSRQKRGFRINSASRVAHGYGKRTFNPRDDITLNSPLPSDMLTVRELGELARENPSLIEALIEKFVDMDGDGLVSSEELFGLNTQ